MTEQEATRTPEWPVCGRSGCLGVRWNGQEECLAHVGAETRKTILAALKPGADLDLRGTPIDHELLDQLLAAVRPKDGPPTLGDARFDRAQFKGTARFNGAQFSGDAWFYEAQFDSIASFDRAKFSGAAGFGRAQFSWEAGFDGAQFSAADAWFDGAQFSGVAAFREAQFSGDARFEEAQFSSTAWFSGAELGGNVWFREAHFNGGAWFDEAQFSGAAWFDRAQFSGAAGFGRAQFSEDARFNETRFKQSGTIGPVLAASTLAFERAAFEQDITIEAVGPQLSCAGTRFAQAATLRLRRTRWYWMARCSPCHPSSRSPPTPSRTTTQMPVGKWSRSVKVRSRRRTAANGLARGCCRFVEWMWPR
jgi:uncharacterized protein YjbI with pentapeptide repeats